MYLRNNMIKYFTYLLNVFDFMVITNLVLQVGGAHNLKMFAEPRITKFWENVDTEWNTNNIVSKKMLASTNFLSPYPCSSI